MVQSGIVLDYCTALLERCMFERLIMVNDLIGTNWKHVQLEGLFYGNWQVVDDFLRRSSHEFLIN